jgi:ABC-2 type transport system permease protein
MSSLNLALHDSRTMLRRNLLHALRYPSLTLGVMAVPLIFLLLFVYVLGEVLGAGLFGRDDGAYIGYLAPGILVMTVAAVAGSTAISVNVDMTEGIINRFRTMAIARSSVLTGHVVGGVITTLLSVVLVSAVAMVVGFRPTARVLEWVAAFGLITCLAFAVIWIAVGIGLVSKGPEAASNLFFPLQLLPFIGSAFVPTDSMPTGLRLFAEYQPFTPMIETVRGLLMGTTIDNSATLAMIWCCGIAVTGFLWSRALYARDPH